MNPGDLRVAQASLRSLPRRDHRNVDHSMMNHGAMLWGAALYNNGGFHLKNYRFGQAYGADGAPLQLINLHAGHAAGHPGSRHSAIHRSAAAIQSEQSGKHSAHFRKGRTQTTCSSAFPQSTNHPANRRAVCPSADSARSIAPIPVFLGSAKDAAARSAARISWDRTITRAIIARAAARPVTSFMRTIVRRAIPVGGASTAIKVSVSPRTNDSEKRARPSDHASIHALDSVEPMHELPHASGKSVRESVSRLHLVGPGNRRRVHVSERAERSDGRRAGASSTQRIRKRPPRAVFGAIWIFSKASPN